ncbi:hypothetical protein ART_4035 [Arthrobacter sp. PAMC 25486]|uniref:lipopolysaccharide biosynthesis protein n=1 Tax=Arthrobacter sp. PAMC 25486 TaxID=1494608 RepID=UPI0005360E85|nr:oligosaccharide flippase family protein [Arthrobacter sp. PAMC 25486]AIY03634.1 hypothetical protein ART_4035 [Arthrobacter sp. PAMC 25486]
MIKNILTTYGARFAALVATVVLLPVVVGAVGTEAYGVYAIAVSLGLLFQQDLGMGAATTRFIAEARTKSDWTRLRQVTAASATFYLVVSLVAALAAAAGLHAGLQTHLQNPALAPLIVPLVILGAGGVGGALLMTSQRQMLAGLGLLDQANTVMFTQALFRIFATVIAVMVFHQDVRTVAAIDTAAVLLAGLAMYIIRRLRSPESRASLKMASWPVFRSIFALSLDLLVLGVASAIIMQAGTILTGLRLPIAEAAVFAAAQRAMTIVKELTNSLSGAVLPAATSRYVQHGTSGVRPLYLRGTRYANMLLVLVLGPLVGCAPFLLQWWVGDEFSAAALPAQILMLSVLINNNHLLALPILTAKGRVRHYAVLHVSWALGGAGLAWFLAPVWGVAGVAAGIVAPLIVLEPLYIHLALKAIDARWKDFWLQCLVGPFAIPIPTGAALWWLLSAANAGTVTSMLAWAAWMLLVGIWYWTVILTCDERAPVAGRLARSRR